MINTLSRLLGNSPKTISNWKKENRNIIKLLYKYFSKGDLEEFLETGKINKMENLNEYYQYNSSLRNKYLNYFNKNNSTYSMDEQSTIPFIFGLFVFIKKHGQEFSNFHSAAISFSLSQYNLVEKTDYGAITAIQKRTLPTLQSLDDIDGMYTYVCSIVNEDLNDLLSVSEDELIEEANLQIEKFEKIKKRINEKLEVIYES